MTGPRVDLMGVRVRPFVTTDRTRARARGYQRAFKRLAELHPEEFAALVAEEYAKDGVA